MTPFGLFEFVRMPFGLRNAAQTFQRFIDEVLRDLHFSYAYIDDVLIASSTPEEHKQHLKLVLDHYRQFGVIINPIKCELGVSELTFLGHYLNSQDKVKAEIRCSTFDREILAMYLAIKHFQRFAEGHQFHVLYNRSQAPDICIFYSVK